MIYVMQPGFGLECDYMADKKWKFREDMLGHCINNVSSKTFQDAEDRLNYLEKFYFTEKEIEQIKYALDHLHDTDLSYYGEENIRCLESVMQKLEMEFISQLD